MAEKSDLPVENLVSQLPSETKTWISAGKKDKFNTENGSSGSGKEMDLVAEKRAVRKLDLLLMPIMTLFYLLSFLVCLCLQ